MTSRGQMDIGPVDVDFQMFVSRYHGSWTFNWTESQISTFHQMLGKNNSLHLFVDAAEGPDGSADRDENNEHDDDDNDER